MDIVADLNSVVEYLQTAELDEAQLRVVTDLGKVNTPCAYVALESIDHYLSHGGEIIWRIYLVADFTDQTRVIAQLEKLLNAVLEIGLSPCALTEYVGLPVPEQSQALPALLIRITSTV